MSGEGNLMHRISKKYLIVDGYNYINQNAVMRSHLQTSLETARNHLNELLSEFSAYSGEIGIAVYDATKGDGLKARQIQHNNIEIVFTKSGQTADSYIECLVATLLKDKSNQVRVITQDWAEQQVILGSGGLRVAAKEWQREIDQMRSDLTKTMTIENNVRPTLEDALDVELIKKLKEI